MPANDTADTDTVAVPEPVTPTVTACGICERPVSLDGPAVFIAATDRAAHVGCYIATRRKTRGAA